MSEMWALAISTLVVCLALGSLINAVLYKPWRVKPIYRFLYRRSAWYRHFRYIESIRAMTRGIRAAEKAMGERLLPAMQKATESMREFVKAVPRG